MILGLFSNVEGKNHIFPNHPSYNGADRHIYLTFCDFVKIGLCPLWTHCEDDMIERMETLSKETKKTKDEVLVDKMVNIFGQVELDEEEKSFLSSGPEFALFEQISRKKANINLLMAATKIRWSRMGKHIE